VWTAIRKFGSSLWLTHWWRERLTRPGRYVLIGGVATGIGGAFPEQMVGSLGFSIFASLVVVSLAVSTWRRPSATSDRIAPSRCMAGVAAPVTVRVTNTGHRAAYDLGAFEFRLPRALKLEPQAQYVDRLAPGESAELKYTIETARRGRYVLPGATVLSTFPFGMTHARRFVEQTHHLMVYPAFTPLRRLQVSVGRRYQPGGVAMISRVGESMEFIGNREYRPGDRVRDLHPRSWARVSVPVVKQFQEEYLSRVSMLVDTYVPRAGLLVPGRHSFRLLGASRPRALEANLSLAAAVADYVAREDYLVDLFAAGPELYHLSAGRSLGHLDNILDILACIERCYADPIEVVGPEFSRMLRRTSSVVALLLSYDDRRARFIDSIRASGASVKVIVVTADRAIAASARSGGAQHLSPDEIERGIDTL